MIWAAIGLKLFGFIAESVFAFFPEYRSASSRNRVHLAPDSPVERHPRGVRQEPPQNLPELEPRREARRLHQAGHTGMGLGDVGLGPGAEGDLRTVQRSDSNPEHSYGIRKTAKPFRPPPEL